MDFPITRRYTKPIFVGSVPIGGNYKISVQSMTNTNTCNIIATIKQINALKKLGADIVRISVPDMASAEAFGEIKKTVNIPLVADIHFDYKIALRVAELGADCLRINPGNILNKDHIKSIISSARTHNIPIRIGVNSGSIDKKLLKKTYYPTAEILYESAMRNIDYFDKLDFNNFKVSIKSSNIFPTIVAYELLSKQIEQPFHVGITESGGLRYGSINSAIGIGLLLTKGIGDTIRVSLSADPKEEIKAGFNILKTLNLRKFGIKFIACPGCSRQKFNVIKILNKLEKSLEDVMTPLDVAVMGCIVNGPGECRIADIGVTGGIPHLIYIDGKPSLKLKNINLHTIETIIRKKASEKK